ncbi:MAG TPA: NAD(P)/FAD-dependent oxidoreductase [Beijerinckiaceae bacterium]|nr:NAD(P)/FAD-dependent oxidoreductase [Beijerinckiaceae bacterium]
MEKIDTAVIGAGVVGLAIARALALAGRDVLVLEAADAIGTETSSRNSEVIHAGIYYAPDSLKARLCVEGRDRLNRFCEAHGVPHKRLGKLIVATAEGQQARLDRIVEGARACGVEDLRALSRAEALAMEPELSCVSAVISPSTGIVDSHALMLALQGEAETHGAQIVFRTGVLSGRIEEDGIVLWTRGEDGDELDLKAALVVNAAGHGAIPLARALAGMPPAGIPGQYFARGCYFSMARKSPFSRLVYPVPVEGGLGVHLTLDMGGAARFGPDVEWIDRLDHTVDPARANAFYAEIRRYWPALEDGALQPAYAGVRPKISGPGEPAADFWIQGPRDHGVAGLVHLFGIESPGLTASLAIADHVCGLLGGGQ